MKKLCFFVGLLIAGGLAGQYLSPVSSSTLGKIITYNNLTATGSGVVPVYGAVHSTAQTLAITTSTLCAAAACTGGLYKVSAYLLSAATCATPGPGAIAVNLSWTDEAGAKATQAIPLDVNNALTFAATLGLGTTTGYAFGNVLIRSTGAQPIQYATVYTACTSGTGTYNLDLTVEQKQ